MRRYCEIQEKVEAVFGWRLIGLGAGDISVVMGAGSGSIPEMVMKA